MNFSKILPAFLATMLTLAVAAKADEADSLTLQSGQEDFELFHKAAIMNHAIYFQDKFNGSELDCGILKGNLGGGSTSCNTFEKDTDVVSVIKHDNKCFAVFKGTRAPAGITQKNVDAFGEDTRKNFETSRLTDPKDMCPVQSAYLGVYNNLYNFLVSPLLDCENSCGDSKCPVILTGHSKGGAVAVVAAKILPEYGLFHNDPYVITFGAPSPIYEGSDDEKCKEAFNLDRHFRVVTAKEADNKLFCDPLSEHARRKIILEQFFGAKYMDGSKQKTLHLGNTILVTEEGEVARAFGDATCYDFDDDMLMVLKDGDFANLNSYGELKDSQPLHNINTYKSHLKEAKNGAIDGLNEGRLCTKHWQCHDNLICDHELKKCVQDPDFINDNGITRKGGNHWGIFIDYDWPANVDDLIIQMLPKDQTDLESRTSQCQQASIKSNTFAIMEFSEAAQVVFGKGSCDNFSLLSTQTVAFNENRQDAAEIILRPTTGAPPSIQYIDGYEAHDTGGCQGRNELGVGPAGNVFECAKKCDKKDDCVSFEYQKNGKTCSLSSSCSQLSLTVNNANDPNYWYRKIINGYVSHDTGGCVGRNELGTFQFDTLTECVAKCNSKDSCASFEYKKSGTRCALSTSCDRPSRTEKNPNSSDYFYTRDIEGYERFDSGGCISRNELGTKTKDTIAKCASWCDSKNDCVSFEYEKEGSTCRLSGSCSHWYQTVQNDDDNNYWYRRRNVPLFNA